MCNEAVRLPFESHYNVLRQIMSILFLNFIQISGDLKFFHLDDWQRQGKCFLTENTFSGFKAILKRDDTIIQLSPLLSISMYPTISIIEHKYKYLMTCRLNQNNLDVIPPLNIPIK